MSECLDLLTVMRTNGAARAFTDAPVTDEQLYNILDNARFAPSGGNKQGWHVIVLKDPAVRVAIAKLAKMGWNEYATLTAAGQRPFAADESGRWPGPGTVDLAAARSTDQPWRFMDGLEHAPALLLVTVDLRQLAATDVELDRTQLVAGGSIYPFCQNILLAARAEGLGLGGVLTTFVVRQEPAAQELLGLPVYMAIAAMIAIGTPDHPITKLARKPVEAFTTVDRFAGPPFTR
jgi:nitroreductase